MLRHKWNPWAALPPPHQKDKDRGVLVELELKIALFLTLGWVGGVGKVDTQSL